jgi:WD40 repeat protein
MSSASSVLHRLGMTAALLLVLLCLSAGGAAKKPGVDAHGDPLPEGAVARLGTVRFRHREKVRFVAALQDGKTVLTISRDSVAWLWSLKTGKELRHFPIVKSVEDNPWPIVVSLSADGTRLATTAFREKAIYFWDVATGRVLSRIVTSEPHSNDQMSLSPDGRLLAASAGYRDCNVYDTKTGKKLRTFPGVTGTAIKDNVYFDIRFSPDSKRLLTIIRYSQKNHFKLTIKQWDVARGTPLFESTEPVSTRARSCTACFSPDGKRLAWGDTEGKIVVLEAATGKLVKRFQGGRGTPDTLVFSKDSKRLIGRGSDGNSLCVWESATGKKIRTIDRPQRANAYSRISNFEVLPYAGLAATPDGKILLFAEGTRIGIIDLESGQDQLPGAGHRGAIGTICYSRDGKTLVSDSVYGTVLLWDALTGKQRKVFPFSPTVLSYHLSKDGEVISALTPDAKVTVTELASGKKLFCSKLAVPFNPGYVVRSPDGKTLATGRDLFVQLFDVKSGKEKSSSFRVNVPGAGQIGFGNAGAFGAGGFGAGGALGALGGVSPTSPAPYFSPDSRSIVLAGDTSSERLSLYNVASGNLVRAFPIPGNTLTSRVAMTADGRSVVAALENASVLVFELCTGQERYRFAPKDKDQQIICEALKFSLRSREMPFALSPDGQWLTLATADSRLIVYDLLAGKTVWSVRGHPSGVTCFAVSPDYTRLAVGGNDGTALIWEMPHLKARRKFANELKATELKTLWAALAGSDAKAAFGAILKLSQSPAATVPFLATQLKPSKPAEVARIDRLIADLDARRFATRKAAQEELTAFGALAVPALEKVLKGKPTLEVRKRVEALLHAIKGRLLAPPQLQTVRAIETLERIATLEARAVLKTLAGGAADAMQTVEATAALARLGK